jgi:hypothetical protein
MKVLLLGDSFVHTDPQNQVTKHWINLLTRWHNWQVDAYGVPGSGPWTAIRAFMKLIKQKDYDLVIMAWSEPNRVYNLSGESNVDQLQIIDSYQSNFVDDWVLSVQQTGLMNWFDQYIKQHHPDTQFWHFHCFPDNDYNKCKDGVDRLYHIFDHGVTMYPSLMYYSVNCDQTTFSWEQFATDQRDGHLSDSRHQLIFDRLNTLISLNITTGIYSLEPGLPSIQDTHNPYTLREEFTP